MSDKKFYYRSELRVKTREELSQLANLCNSPVETFDDIETTTIIDLILESHLETMTEDY